MASERSASRSGTRAAMLAAVIATCAGCGRTVLDTSSASALAAADDELDFWDDLERRLVVTNHDALHALLMLVEDDRAWGDWAAHLDAARGRGWVGTDADPDPNEAATTGAVAVAVCEILDVEGGLTMRLLGPSPRYCTRELVYLEIIPRRTENQSLRGSEFVDLVGRVEARLQETSMREPLLTDDH